MNEQYRQVGRNGVLKRASGRRERPVFAADRGVDRDVWNGAVNEKWWYGSKGINCGQAVASRWPI